MSFAQTEVVELHAENCRQAFRSLAPDAGIFSAKHGERTFEQLDDNEVAGLARSYGKVERAAVAMTRRQVGAEAWRRYRDDVSRVVVRSGGLGRGARRAVARYEATGEVPSTFLGLSVQPPT